MLIPKTIYYHEVKIIQNFHMGFFSALKQTKKFLIFLTCITISNRGVHGFRNGQTKNLTDPIRFGSPSYVLSNHIQMIAHLQHIQAELHVDQPRSEECATPSSHLHRLCDDLGPKPS